MNNVAISIFKNEAEAENARAFLLGMDRDGSLGLEDVLTATKDPAGKVSFGHLTYSTLGGAILGGFIGALCGIIVLNPVFALGGLVIGLVIGGVSGASTHVGIDPEFARSEVEDMQPGSSALLIMNEGNIEHILDELEKIRGTDILGNKVCTQKGEVRQCSLWTRPTVGMGVPAYA